MTTHVLHAGDRVSVSTSWGDGPIEEHTAIGIFTRDSDELPEVAWARLTDRSIVVDLDDGHWAYGYQLQRIAS